MTLYLYENHTYYNRKIVRYREIFEYDEAWGSSVAAMSSVNFNANNGITTTQIINYDLDSPYADGSAAPSYCIVCDESGSIVSRWWITGHTKIRTGQYSLNLVRDVIADYYDEIMEAPSFIKKGYIPTVNDTAIFNNEDMSFNQIKKTETGITDKSRAAWYVGYINKSAGATTISIPTSTYKISAEYNSLEDYPYYAYTNVSNPFIADYTDITFRLNYYNSMAQGWDANGNPKLPTYNRQAILYTSYGTISTTDKKGFVIVAEGKHVLSDILPYVSNAAKNSGYDWKAGSYALTGAHSSIAINALEDHAGDYILIDGQTYLVSLTPTTVSKKVDIDNSNIFAQEFKKVAEEANRLSGTTMIRTNSITDNWSAIEFTANAYIVNLIPQTTESLDYTLPISRTHCADAPYDIIAIPATYLWVDDKYVSCDASLSKKIVDALMIELGTNAYDWQLLPYCPLPDNVFTGTSYGILQTSRLESTDYSLIGDDDLYTIIVFARRSNFNKVNTTAKISVPTSSIDFKVANETNMYRLCSPNYNGQFEFSATKNGGVSSWNISCSYKPFSPYIKVAPNFGNLYGANFFDARGLICGGDFSIAQVSDEWTNYQIQNKNYQVMFDRQIENMEVNNSVQRIQESVKAAIGVGQGAATGGMAGAMSGNPYIAAAGAVVGGGASLIGGRADMQLNEKLRAEALDYTKDRFGYQLQNIKALPYSLTKIAAQTADYKYFPFVEYYTCTEIEKQALLDKITWDGMSIMRIGKFKDFLRGYYTEEGTFIQGAPIRLDYLSEDSQLNETIAAELQTGVYII